MILSIKLRIKLVIIGIMFFIFSIAFQNVNFVQALKYGEVQQSDTDYDHEIELEYGILTQISEVSAPHGNFFIAYAVIELFIKAEFSNNSGLIWINDQKDETIWKDYLNKSIQKSIDVSNTSTRKYSLWANSSTLGNNTLYYSFSAKIFSAPTLGTIIIIIAIFTSIGVSIPLIYYKVRKKEPASVRLALRVTKKLKKKYMDKHKEKLAKIEEEKIREKE